ncbi:hypothetical protein [Solidesulfovibrio alcoholivorans]|uniref:hypothetical protein n=1 Tax=Solidesulfovibrio alcoholivorans TaxID=81406 RepID=UPI0004956880|nr:hypothetical protein [Solidesulfovibrio alcoholivorans]
MDTKELVKKWCEGKDLTNEEISILCKEVTSLCRDLIPKTVLDVTVQDNEFTYIPIKVEALAFLSESYNRIDSFIDAMK